MDFHLTAGEKDDVDVALCLLDVKNSRFKDLIVTYSYFSICEVICVGWSDLLNGEGGKKSLVTILEWRIIIAQSPTPLVGHVMC